MLAGFRCDVGFWGMLDTFWGFEFWFPAMCGLSDFVFCLALGLVLCLPLRCVGLFGFGFSNCLFLGVCRLELC